MANWLELVPGVDSIGIWENLPHLRELQAEEAAHRRRPAAFERGELHDIYDEYDAQNEGDLRIPEDSPVGLLIRADGNVARETRASWAWQADPEKADWTIVPFLRAPATDLNFTLALALVSMFMVQYLWL
jgi:hypothetical protein